MLKVQKRQNYSKILILSYFQEILSFLYNFKYTAENIIHAANTFFKQPMCIKADIQVFVFKSTLMLHNYYVTILIPN